MNYKFIEEIVVPIYDEILYFGYMDLEGEELDIFTQKVKKIINYPNLKKELIKLIDNFDDDNWRVRIVISWFISLLSDVDLQQIITRYLNAKGGDIGNEIYIYSLAKFDNLETRVALNKFINTKTRCNEDIEFAKAVLFRFDNIFINPKAPHNIFLTELLDKKKEFQTKFEIPFK